MNDNSKCLNQGCQKEGILVRTGLSLGGQPTVAY